MVSRETMRLKGYTGENYLHNLSWNHARRFTLLVMLHRLKKPDPLIVLILIAVAIAIIAPARGTFADVFGSLTNVAIALLFFSMARGYPPKKL